MLSDDLIGLAAVVEAVRVGHFELTVDGLRLFQDILDACAERAVEMERPLREGDLGSRLATLQSFDGAPMTVETLARIRGEIGARKERLPMTEFAAHAAGGNVVAFTPRRAPQNLGDDAVATTLAAMHRIFTAEGDFA